MGKREKYDLLKIEDPEEWLKERTNGIGASEASAVYGNSQFMSNIDLWKIKTGKAEPKDMSSNQDVQDGKEWESVIRNIFTAKYKDKYDVEYHPYWIYRSKKYPFMFATLDGVLTDKDTGERLVLEIKNCKPQGKFGWQEWDNGRVKSAYYAQIVHQVIVTGFSGAILVACLHKRNGDFDYREYEFDKAVIEQQKDDKTLIAYEREFWDCVVNKKIPSPRLELSISEVLKK